MIKLVQLNEDLEHLSDELKDKATVSLDDTQAQVALEHDDLVKKVRQDTKSAVDSTNEIAKKTNADGEAREIFESLTDSPREEDIPEIRPETPEEFGITGAITQMIKDCWDNIDKINSYLITFDNDLSDELRELLQDIIDDNMVHITKLEGNIG